MSLFSNSVDKILKGAHFLIADLEQHAKNMLKDVGAHAETIAQATEQKVKASNEHQRAVLLAQRFKNLLNVDVPNASPPVKPLVPNPSNANIGVKKPNAM